jgi:hypothetical protein
MAIDFRQVHDQVRQLGENAPLREQRRRNVRELARKLLKEHAADLAVLQEKVQSAVQAYDPTLRCALPVEEILDAHVHAPDLPAQATILAADGSQIAPDRHTEVEYGLINVGAIELRHGSPEPPKTSVVSRLMYDEDLYTNTGTLTEATLALRRDLNERRRLAELAEGHPPPIITFTDGPMELWGGPGRDDGTSSEFQKHLQDYQEALHHLHQMGVTTAGYVDKPGANLVVRLLEVWLATEADLRDLRTYHPLRGVTDIDLYRQILEPGERSAIFAMQSYSAKNYRGPLALHFFYLNVGRSGHPWLARVEIPAWVAESQALLGPLHATLVSQCRIMGNRPYPYLLHRAHEAAVVTQEEKEQVIQMIALELRRRGVSVGERSSKQAAKELAGRSSYGR